MSITSVSSQSATSYWEELFNISNSKQSQESDNLATLLFSDLDADSNGKVSLQESGLDQQTYDAMDTDQDGAVSLEELGKALELQRSAMFTRIQLGEEAEKITLPVEESGVTKAQELLAAIMNGEAMVASGAMATSGQAGNVASTLADLDEDAGNGAGAAESGGGQTVFDAMDTNQDGVVSAEELAAALEKQKEATNNGANSPNKGIAQKAKDLLSVLAHRAYNAMTGRQTGEQAINLTA